MTDTVITYFPRLCQICISIGLAEMFFSVLWWRFYFTFGIPIFNRSMQVNSGHLKLPNHQEIEYAISRIFSRPTIAIRQINETSYCFRDSFSFGLTGNYIYLPLMHGMILYDEKNMKMKVKAYPNWYIFLFSCSFVPFILSVIIESKQLKFIAIFIGFLALIVIAHLHLQKLLKQLSTIVEKMSN